MTRVLVLQKKATEQSTQRRARSRNELYEPSKQLYIGNTPNTPISKCAYVVNSIAIERSPSPLPRTASRSKESRSRVLRTPVARSSVPQIEGSRARVRQKEKGSANTWGGGGRGWGFGRDFRDFRGDTVRSNKYTQSQPTSPNGAYQVRLSNCTSKGNSFSAVHGTKIHSKKRSQKLYTIINPFLTKTPGG